MSFSKREWYIFGGGAVAGGAGVPLTLKAWRSFWDWRDRANAEKKAAKANDKKKTGTEG